MTLEEAIKFITKNYTELHEAQTSDKIGYSKPEMHAIWVGKSDIAGSYEVDEEWIGVTPEGRIAWAYASGCSCWSGDFSEGHESTIKEVKLAHSQVLPEQWEAAIIKFAETKEFQAL